jgi:hypothetical protein
MAHYVSIRNGMTNADEKDLSNIEVAFLSTGGGVVGSGDYLVAAQASPNASVLVATGRGYVPTSDGTMTYSTLLDANATVSIASNSSGSARIDAVVLYCDLSASVDANASNVAKFYDVQGTPAGSPSAPTNAQILTAIGASNPYIILATVYCANGFTSISAGNITDQRVFATFARGGDSVFQSGFSNFISSGIAIPTSATLISSSSAGVMYYGGSKITVASDGGHTYTASKDTYVDVSNNGVYAYSAVSNSAAAPALTASSIRVAKVVTGASAVTSVIQSGLDSNNVPIYPTSPVNTATNSQFGIGKYAPAGAGITTIDLSLCLDNEVTMPAATQTLAISNAVIGKKFIVTIVNVTSQGTLTWFSTIRWSGGTTPTLTGTNLQRDVFGFKVTGSGTYDGFIVGQNL